MWTFSIRFLSSASLTASDAQKLFPLLILESIFAPSLGFFNMFVNIQPKYLGLGRHFKGQTRLWRLRRAIFGNQVKRRAPVVEKSEKESKEKGGQADETTPVPVAVENNVDTHTREEGNKNP